MVKGGGLEKYWTDSEVYRCQGGNQQLARKLARGHRRGACADADDRCDRLPSPTRGVRVTLANGKVLEADDVDAHGAAVGLEPHRHRSGAAGGAGAADGQRTSSA